MSDPWKLPGLAHFLEHMLFLGTTKVRVSLPLMKLAHSFIKNWVSDHSIAR